MSKTPNSRADMKNPNNPAFKVAIDHRSVQLNTKVVAAAKTTVKATPIKKK